jgi:hypothetical protein
LKDYKAVLIMYAVGGGANEIGEGSKVFSREAREILSF